MNTYVFRDHTSMKVAILSQTVLIIAWLMLQCVESASLSASGTSRELKLNQIARNEKLMKEDDETNSSHVGLKIPGEYYTHKVVHSDVVNQKTKNTKQSDRDLINASDKHRENQKLLIDGLRVRLDDLKSDVQANRREKSKAAEGVRMASDRRNKLIATTRAISQKRIGAEKDLSNIQKKLSQYDSILQTLFRQAKVARESIRQMEDRGKKVLLERRNITNEFLRHGLEQWVDKSLSNSVSPLVKDAFMQGTTQIVEPVIEGIERLTNASEQLNTRVSTEIEDRISTGDIPFYAGFITYVLILIPIVLTTSVVLKFKRRMIHIKPEHFIAIGNVYFGLMSFGCYMAISLVSANVLAVLRRSHSWIFQSLVMIHVLCYLFLLFLHFCIAVQSKKHMAILHLVLLLCIGSHFAIQSINRWSQEHVSAANNNAYLMYSFLFGFILYQVAKSSIRLSFKGTGWPYDRKNKSSCQDNHCKSIRILSLTFEDWTQSKQHRPSDLDHMAELLNDYEGNTSETVFGLNPKPKDEVRLAVGKVGLSHKMNSSSAAVKAL